MVLTEEVQTDQYPVLSFENDDPATPNVNELTEQNNYWENANGQSINVTSVRTGRPAGFNSQTTNGDYVRNIKKSTGAIGAGKLLKVMAGDRIHTYVEYFYTDANASNSGADPVNSFVNSLISVFGNNAQVGGLLKNEASAITSQLQGNSTFTSFINPAPNTSGSNQAPKAYLNVLFFDDQFKFDANSSVIVKVNYSPNTPQYIDKRFSNAITANKSGYVYVYFSNESESNVYFDNFMLTHEHSSLIEESHFYPFGGRLEGLCSKAYNKLENKFQFNGKERQAKEFSDGSGLEMYDFGARMYDNQIGRWMAIDPLSEKMRRHSPYNYAFDNPVRFIDPDGMAPATYEEVRNKARNYRNEHDRSQEGAEEDTDEDEVDNAKKQDDTYDFKTSDIAKFILYHTKNNEKWKARQKDKNAIKEDDCITAAIEGLKILFDGLKEEH
jgi:RHS repeat-associated protein